MTPARNVWLHPLVGAVAPLAVSPFILVGGRWRFLLAVLLACCLLAARDGRHLVRRSLAVVAVTFSFVALSFWAWLGGHSAVLLGLRMSALVATVSVAYSLVNWQMLADTLIAHCRLPYPLVDVLGMGHRFIALMRRECTEMSTRLRIEAKGSILIWVRSLPRMVIPMLVASFRVADLTAIAMESRGFASQAHRTTHHARRPGLPDLLALGLLTAATLIAAHLL